MTQLSDVIKGFATPAMVGSDERGRVLNAFEDPADVDRIEKGYGCGNCCAIFYTFQLECPVCHLATNVSAQRQETPPDWSNHVKTRHGHEATKPRTFDDAMRDVLADPDVDHVPLRKLKPSRWGAGR